MDCNWIDKLAGALNRGMFLVEHLNDVEKSDVEFWLSVTGISVAVLIVLLLAFAVSLRMIAARRTQPCRWCMEFIPKASARCPRCGKPMAAAEASMAPKDPANQG